MIRKYRPDLYFCTPSIVYSISHKIFKIFMRSFRFFTSLLSFIILTVSYSSGQGCAVNYGTTSEIIYYGALSGTRNFGAPVAYNNSPSTAYPSACPKYSYDDATTNGQTCRVNGTLIGNYYIPASRIIFVPCPLDDYIPFLILPIGMLGFPYFRKKNFNVV